MKRSIVLKSRPMQIMEHRLGRPLDEFLQERYVEQQRTQREIAAELDVDESTVGRWMARLGIEARMPGPQRIAS